MKITSDIEKFLRGYKDLEVRDAKFLMMLTTNNIAFDALKSLRMDVHGHLHVNKKSIPTAWRTRKATKNRPYAELYVDEWAWQYKVLRHHYTGGDRARKGMEKAMIYGGYMRPGEILTPPPGVRIRPQAYNEMMSQLRLNYKAGFDANETKRSKTKKKRRGYNVRYFIVTGRSSSPMAPGVYAKVPGVPNPVCMLRIAERPEYKKRLSDEEIIRKVIERRGQQYLNKAFGRMMAIKKAKGWA